MKRSELKKIIESVINEESFNADKKDVFRLSYFDNKNAYQYKQEYFIGSLTEAKAHATKTKNKDAWVEIDSPSKWTEKARIK